MKKWLKRCLAAASFCLLFGVGGMLPAAAAECLETNNGIQGHVWEETDGEVISIYQSGTCCLAGNPGIGRTCTVCGKSQRFFTAGDWVYALREDGTAEIVRCDKPMEECSLVEIPSQLDGIPVTAIGDYAFRECYWVGGVIIPEGITRIGDFAFEYCSGLKEITIPDSVESMGCNPFLGIGVEIHLAEGSIRWNLMNGSLYTRKDKRLIYAPKIKSGGFFYVPEGTLEIGDYAFYGSYFSAVSLPRSIRKIGNSAFEKCTQLESIVIPEGTEKIGDFAFCECSALRSLQLPETLEWIGVNPFFDTPVHLQISSHNTSYVITDGVLFEKKSEKLIAFPYVSTREFYEIPDGITEIGAYAFADCGELTRVKIPGSVRRIGKGAFYDCYGLRAVALPDGMTAIESSTFSRCYQMKTITIPDSVTEIGKQAFYDCHAMETVSLPAELRSLGEGAFQGCVFLREVELPSGITEVPQLAFDGCIMLEKVTLPSGITKIEPFAFSYCESLEQIKLPDSLREICRLAFFGTRSLKAVTIPKSVESIDESAFYWETTLIVQ